MAMSTTKIKPNHKVLQALHLWDLAYKYKDQRPWNSNYENLIVGIEDALLIYIEVTYMNLAILDGCHKLQQELLKTKAVITDWKND